MQVGGYVRRYVYMQVGSYVCISVCLFVCMYIRRGGYHGGVGGRWTGSYIYIYLYTCTRICQKKFRSIYFRCPELCKSTDRMVTAMKVNINDCQQQWLTTATMVTAMKVNSTDFPSHEVHSNDGNSFESQQQWCSQQWKSTAMMVTAMKVNSNDGHSNKSLAWELPFRVFNFLFLRAVSHESFVFTSWSGSSIATSCRNELLLIFVVSGAFHFPLKILLQKSTKIAFFGFCAEMGGEKRWEDTAWDEMRWDGMTQWDAMSNFQEKLRCDEIRWNGKRSSFEKRGHRNQKSKDCCCEAQKAHSLFRSIGYRRFNFETSAAGLPGYYLHSPFSLVFHKLS